MDFLKKLTGNMGAGGGAALLAVASALSYFFGLVRDLLLAHYFGASNLTDAYATAFLIPDFIFNLFIAGALTGVLMPMFISTEKNNKNEAEELFSAFFTIMNAFVSLIAILAYFLAPLLISKVFQNADVEQQKLIISLTRIMLFSPILFGISNSFASILLAKKRFFSVATGAIFYNIGILLGILFFAEKFGIKAAAWGTVFGCFLHLVSRVVDFAYADVKLKISFDFKNKNFHKVLLLALPKTLGLIAFQGMLWGYNYLGYYLQEGSIAAFNYARNIQSFSVSLFGIALATAVFPFLADFIAENNKDKFAHRLEKSARQILFLALPASVGLFLVAQNVVQVLFVRGNFETKDMLLTTWVLSAMAISIPFESLSHLFSRAFLANKNTIIPMISQIIFFAGTFGIASYLLFVESMNVRAFGISFSIATILQFLFLFLFFHYKFIKFPIKEFFIKFSKHIFLTLILAFVCYYSLIFFEPMGAFAQLGGTVFLSTFIYFSGAFILQMPEVDRVAIYFKQKFINKK